MANANMERLTAPSDLAPIVTLERAKQHLRVSHLLENDLIESYIAAATDHLDGYSGVLGRALRPQRWRRTLDPIPCGQIRLPLTPFAGEVEITYLDDDGAEQTLAADLYRVTRDHGFGVVTPAPGAAWPSGSEIRVAYDCGYEAEALPPAIGQAALLLIGDAYDNRSAGVEGRIVGQNPAVDRLLRPYVVRSWS